MTEGIGAVYSGEGGVVGIPHHSLHLPEMRLQGGSKEGGGLFSGDN